jgi:two-component system OmpR family response regulator
MTKERVLIVDDEIEFTEILSQRMEARDMAVDTAAGGREALEKARGKSYDAIILDLSMPEMDGMETLEHLLQENPDLQVIVLTGYATVEKGVEAIQHGAMQFLRKPAELQDLIDQIQSAKAKKMVLVEKRIEEKVQDILQTKGW